MKSIGAIFALLTIPVMHAAAQTKPDRPNILWIVSEDNTTFLGCYGDQYATTPNLDRFATQGVLYENAFSTAPVCAPSRNTLITGMLPTSLGTENMRSTYPVPSFVQFFPKYLRAAGYYTTNNSKKDYNTIDQADAWDESSDQATYKNRKPGQPFFAVFNIFTTHESSIFGDQPNLKHDPEKAPVPPYLPKTTEMKHDWALYYDKIEQMDNRVGQLLQELEESGQADNTIVFYYADNGGVLGRSKRFIYESGLHVPLIIRFPEKYKHLSPGTRTDQLVTFVDFAPTVLNLAGITVPSYIQGRAFAGPHLPPPHDYAFNFRGRMDERDDKVRSIRDKQYRYVRNFYPHKIYGQHVEFLWKAASMRSWEREYKAGNLNELQSRFWKEKPVEELYDVINDPDNIHNLAGKKEYQQVLVKMRGELHRELINTKDAGFIPEAQLTGIIPYEYAHSSNYDITKVLETAEAASSRDVQHLPALVKKLKDKDAVIRYWAATGITILGASAASAKKDILPLLQDESIAVKIAAAEAAYKLGQKEDALKVLLSAIDSPNDMARLQALNVLQSVDRTDLAVFQEKLKSLSATYDVALAKYLLNN
ncbi:sulfatase-like hydrolase/transferase [Chitinophaga sp.]|uniref:sulfatase-like hydrolase/transferase n=1 Tax=Chitinophaga sp. TaxID=1869181 RepID=UPI0031DC3B26